MNALKLDPNVEFFVHALQKLGAETHASCEGHVGETLFYVMFSSSYELAVEISKAHWFVVTIEEDAGLFAIRRSFPWETDEDKRKVLSWARQEWKSYFGGRL